MRAMRTAAVPRRSQPEEPEEPRGTPRNTPYANTSHAPYAIAAGNPASAYASASNVTSGTGTRFPCIARRTTHNSAGYSTVAMVICHSQRTAYTPAPAITIAPTAAPCRPRRSSRNQKYANKNDAFSFRKRMAV